MSTEQNYLAYMLRLWQVSSDGEPIWRASLESSHSGERRGFANLELLFAFLGEKTGELAQREEQRCPTFKTTNLSADQST